MARIHHLSARATAATATVLTLSLAACGSSGSDSPSGEATGTPEPGGVATVALYDEPNTLDPAGSPAKAAYQVLMTMCEGLYTVNEAMEAVPQLATEMPTVSADGLQVTIPLRTDAVFNDGSAFDAAAAKAWIERNQTVEPSSAAVAFADVESIDASDPARLVLTMSKPDARLVNALAGVEGLIGSPKSAQVLKEGTAAGTAPVCVAPFALEEWTAGESISLVKSDTYYDADDVALDGVEFIFMPDSNARMVNVQSGDVDAALAIAPTDADRLAAASDIRVGSQIGIGFQSIVINTANGGAGGSSQISDRPLAASPELREAFNLAIDRSALVKAVSADKSTPGCSMLSPSSPYYDDPDCPSADIARATELVEQSGVQTPVEVSLLVTSDPVTTRLAQIVQSMVKEVGFDLTIDPVDPAAGLQRVATGDFDAVALSFGGLPDPDSNIARFVSSTGILNGGKQFTPTSERLLAEAATETDESARKDLYRDLLAEIRSWNSTIVLFHPVQLMAADRSFVGYTWTTGGEIILKTAGFSKK